MVCCLSMESIRLGGPAHGIVTKTVHKTLSGGGWVVGRGGGGPGGGRVQGWLGVVGAQGVGRGGGIQGLVGVQGMVGSRGGWVGVVGSRGG